MKQKTLIDLDDLWDEQQIIDLLVPLREANENLVVTVYAIPNRLGPVHDLKVKYPWIQFAQHGFEHTFAECRAWTDTMALEFLSLGAEMGYEPVFKPPNWIFDEDTEAACKEAGVILHHHEDDEPGVRGLKAYPGPFAARGKHTHRKLHTHILRNPSTDFILDAPEFRPENIAQHERFLTLPDVAEIVWG